jgi:dephospho-CoA kinase
MAIIGLTGNYGMGKSTVSKIFEELGAIVIDADSIVRELLEKEELISMIKDTFGDDVIKMEDNKPRIDKKKLADIVFENPHLRISLENILHPLVFKKINEKIEQIRQITKDQKTEPLIIIEATVIFERGYQNRFDKIITVYTDEETAIKRLLNKGISEDDIKKRLKSQFPVEMKINKSDFVVDNSKDLEYTRYQVMEIYKRLSPEKRTYGNN